MYRLREFLSSKGFSVIRNFDDLCILIKLEVAIISGDGKYVEKVREARPGINLPNVVCVDAKGLHLKEDRLQLTAESQVKLGHILADAYLKDSASSLLKIKGIDCLVFDVSGFCTVLLISVLFLPFWLLLIAGF